MQALKINSERLWKSIADLAQVGAYRDEVTGLFGVNRLALTEADGQGRAQVKAWFEEAGLTVRVDRIGNCYGRRAGQADLPPVLVGSHIDSVPTGGAFDGSLGVLGGLEVVRCLNEARVQTRRPIEVGFFTDEEGARFGTDMLGSAVACGRIPLEQALGLKDRGGVSVGEALDQIGFRGDREVRVEPPHAYLEVHIEQGPILRAAGVELGVVSGVQAISWRQVNIRGASAHAGTTPMNLRKDAALAASRLNLKMNEMAVGGRYGDLRATMGTLEPAPNMVNIVPGRVRCTVDLRNPDDAQMARAEADLLAFLSALEGEMGVAIQSVQTAKTQHVGFASPIRQLLAAKMDKARLTHQDIISGAGHDAQEFAALCPTGMIFVPGEHDGISHNPREYSTPEQCQRGVDILLQAVLELAA